MRYLKKFNEKESFEEELNGFCNDYLSYLKDKGFEIVIEYLRMGDVWIDKIVYRKFKIEISLPMKDGRCQLFNYSDIKEDFCQFIKMLDNEYTISSRLIKYVGVKCGNIDIDDIDDIDELKDISEIFIMIQHK